MNQHLIKLSKAIEMTALYRQEMTNILKIPYQELEILPLCETFSRSAFDELLAVSGCTSVRIYYGMSEDLKIHAIGVAVNSNNEDILMAENALTEEDEDPVIIEESFRCPPICPPESPLNTDPV